MTKFTCAVSMFGTFNVGFCTAIMLRDIVQQSPNVWIPTLLVGVNIFMLALNWKVMWP